MASTESMLGQGSGQLNGREVTKVFQASQPTDQAPPIHLAFVCPRVLQTTTLLAPYFVSSLAGLLLRDGNSGDWEGPQL